MTRTTLVLLACFCAAWASAADDAKALAVAAQSAKASAEKGDASAQFRYAEMLRDGRGVAKNMCEAVVWPGRFQRVGRFIVDGAHNPPAAQALVSALAQSPNTTIPQSHNPTIP